MKPSFKIGPEPRMTIVPLAVQAQTLFREGLRLQNLGQLEQAHAIYLQVLGLQPRHFDALHMLGVIAGRTGNPTRAIELISKAIEVNPSVAAAYANRGNALSALKQHQAAIESYGKALAIKPDYANAYGNRGTALNELKQYQAAIASYDKATAINPDHALAWCNCGVAWYELKQYQAAIDRYDRAIAIAPAYADAYANRAAALNELKQYQAAVHSYDNALAIEPAYAFLYGRRLHAKMRICDWSDADNQITELAQRIQHNKKATPAFAVLALSASSSLQRVAAEIWFRERCSANVDLGAILKRPKGQKIRLGYFSADFHN